MKEQKNTGKNQAKLLGMKNKIVEVNTIYSIKIRWNKIEKNWRTGRGCGVCKNEKLIHGFKFMLQMNWM